MTSIRLARLFSAAAIGLLASGTASATTYLFDFEFDALASFAQTRIVYSADNLDPGSLDYVSGDVNGVTSPTLVLTSFGPGFRGYQFFDSAVPPVGAIRGIFFSTPSPVAAGGTYETDLAGRAIYLGSGVTDYSYTTGRLRVSLAGAAVPEPASWALLIAGFLGVGGAIRSHRRRRIRAVVALAYL